MQYYNTKKILKSFIWHVFLWFLYSGVFIWTLSSPNARKYSDCERIVEQILLGVKQYVKIENQLIWWLLSLHSCMFITINLFFIMNDCCLRDALKNKLIWMAGYDICYLCLVLCLFVPCKRTEGPDKPQAKSKSHKLV